jgi:hypothetical protein
MPIETDDMRAHLAAKASRRSALLYFLIIIAAIRGADCRMGPTARRSFTSPRARGERSEFERSGSSG